MTKITCYHDGECPLCRAEVKLMQKLDQQSSIHWIDISQNAQALDDVGISYQQAMMRMHVLDNTQTMQTGVRGFLVLWRQLAYYRNLARLIDRFPVLIPLLERFYRIFASYRLTLTGRNKTRTNH